MRRPHSDPTDIGAVRAYQLIGGSLIQRSGLSVPPPGHDCAGCGKYASVAHRSDAGDGRQPIASMTTVGPMLPPKLNGCGAANAASVM